MPSPAPKRGPGRPELPADERRVPVALRLPPRAAELLRALSELTGETQTAVVVAALETLGGMVTAQLQDRTREGGA